MGRSGTGSGWDGQDSPSYSHWIQIWYDILFHSAFVGSCITIAFILCAYCSIGVSISDYVDKQPSLGEITTFEEQVHPAYSMHSAEDSVYLLSPFHKETDGRSLAEVKRLGEHINALDGRLLENEKKWKASAESQAATDKKWGETKDEPSKLQEKLQVVVHEKNNIEIKLNSTQREYELLLELKDMYKTKSEEEKEKVLAVQKMVDEKEKELEQQLKAKDVELQPLQQEVNGLREELDKRTTELMAKAKQIDELERERDSNRLDIILQQLATQVHSHESYKVEVKVRLY